MNPPQLSIGFVGFGEAGYGLAKGLGLAGLEQITAYDKFWDTPPYNEVIQSRAKDAKVRILPDVQKLASCSDFILSTVTVSVAKEAAEQVAAFLREEQIYVDMNSCSSHTKQDIALIINKSGAKFVDAAVIGAVTSYGHKVPILACGAGAAEFQSRISSHGMNIRCIEGKPGSAAAVKMVCSIYTKGLEALLIETLVAAYKYDTLDLVLDLIAEVTEGRPFKETVNRLITTDVIHARRRVGEMNEVIATLNEVNIEPVMSKATRTKLEQSVKLHLREYFKDKIPEKYIEVLKAISSLSS